jgi:hypothetical protein
VKKVRINLKRGVRSWSFILYDSAESAFFLRKEPIYNDGMDEYRQVVNLRPGEIIEVEWMGSEWVYSGVSAGLGQERFDKVRLGKLVPIKGSTGDDAFIEAYSGWVVKEVPWTPDDSRKDVRITPLHGKVKPKIELSNLFSEQDEEPLVVSEGITSLTTGNLSN